MMRKSTMRNFRNSFFKTNSRYMSCNKKEPPKCGPPPCKQEGQVDTCQYEWYPVDTIDVCKICKNPKDKPPRPPQCPPKKQPPDCKDIDTSDCNMVAKLDVGDCCECPSYHHKCATSFNKQELKKNNPPFKSMWNYPEECCEKPCPDLLPRFDEMYWCPTDKYTRNYQQTWIECPGCNCPKKPKKFCVDVNALPPICRRDVRSRPNTASQMDNKKFQMACSAKPIEIKPATTCAPQAPTPKADRCSRVKNLCCEEGRIPPDCHKYTKRADCTKYCCPYPAYSECCKMIRCPPRPVECRCLAKPMQCEVLAFLRRKENFKLPPKLPAWPPMDDTAKPKC